MRPVEPTAMRWFRGVLIAFALLADVAVSAPGAVAPARAQTTDCNSPDLHVFNITPVAHVNQAYQGAIPIGGGTYPYTFTLAKGSPPPELTMDSTGRVTGTPLLLGEYDFTVQVVDSSTPPLCTTSAQHLQIDSGTPVENTLQSTLEDAQSLAQNGPRIIQAWIEENCAASTLSTLVNHTPPNPDCML